MNDHLRIINVKQPPDLPITRYDITEAEGIFGPNLGSLKGKSIKRASPEIMVMQSRIPSRIQYRYMNITLSLDIVFVNKVTFVITILRNINFITSEFIPNRMQEGILASMKQNKIFYSHGGFRIKECNDINKFGTLCGGITPLKIKLNTVGDVKYTEEAEQCI